MDKKYQTMNYKEYTLPIDCRIYEDGNRTMFCPICGKEYDRYLFCLDGYIGCKYCMGRKGIDILSAMIKQGVAVIVEGEIRNLDLELAKAIGILPRGIS